MLVQYQLELELEDGSRATSPRGTFGVIRSSVISMNLTGEAFESNSAKLTAGAIEALTSAIPILEAHPKEQIFVEGHTDSLGAREHNHELSYRRAEEAVRFFTDRGLPRSQFVVRGYGEDRPFVSNETEEGRALNRRIEIRVSAALGDIEGVGLSLAFLR